MNSSAARGPISIFLRFPCTLIRHAVAMAIFISSCFLLLQHSPKICSPSAQHGLAWSTCIRTALRHTYAPYRTHSPKGQALIQHACRLQHKPWQLQRVFFRNELLRSPWSDFNFSSFLTHAMSHAVAMVIFISFCFLLLQHSPKNCAPSAQHCPAWSTCFRTALRRTYAPYRTHSLQCQTLIQYTCRIPNKP